jgi:hypothetical protein
VDYLRILAPHRARFDQVCHNPEEQGICKVVEGQEEMLKGEGMVFICAARLRWEKVADYLCEIVQYILEVDSLYMEYELVLVWHTTLCQTMEYPTVSTFTHSLYDVVVAMRFEEDPEFEFAVNHLSRWMEPFESLKNIEDSVFQVLYWMHASMEGHRSLSRHFERQGLSFSMFTS